MDRPARVLLLVLACCCASLFFSLAAASRALKDHRHQGFNASASASGAIDNPRGNGTQRREAFSLLGCGSSGNPIDDCWRCDPNWHNNRKRLAECAIGFGRNAIGGKNGEIYVVTDSSDDDPVNPKPGTLRYGVIQSEPLWIIFERDMSIRLSQELIVNSYKTIDGRGANVEIAHGPCITIQYVSHVIVHGIAVHDCKPGGPAMVRSSTTHFGWRTVSDGDGISIFGSNNIWVDHCTLARCTDGLIDAIMASTDITISNNHFSDHDKVMLLGHNDDYTADRAMQVTVAYNHFGQGLVERMPRCRHGYFHVVNNDYTEWRMYAIGGSANPTINAEGNRFFAGFNENSKEITKREYTEQSIWKSWNWRSEGNLFMNGAYFITSGAGSGSVYGKASSLAAKPAAYVGELTLSAGALLCGIGFPC
ncbi:hypothetical protein SELMODRAFT_407495 [Selaginella moellendorffii]|uniref:Pectate lyase n=1 Tax=Selaginella moellendorffii TaxID=88036 RepID=D8R5T1_SELML|nr:probable pectate lyase 18 [Selaginella moellendorffii]EFJ32208.1 hypothetical protein SELMODRAFT_407495 [Selaginella moellendorffii]|eukprot:XP_002966181.1 probable pectate lyase 18 [Selaginella moellendorffii]